VSNLAITIACLNPVREGYWHFSEMSNKYSRQHLELSNNLIKLVVQQRYPSNLTGECCTIIYAYPAPIRYIQQINRPFLCCLPTPIVLTRSAWRRMTRKWDTVTISAPASNKLPIKVLLKSWGVNPSTPARSPVAAKPATPLLAHPSWYNFMSLSNG
jgi:hypothetical protein